MKLQARPAQVRVHSFRLDPDHWVRFQVLAQKRGVQASGALRQLVRQFAAEPFPWRRCATSAAKRARDGSSADADAVEKLETAARPGRHQAQRRATPAGRRDPPCRKAPLNPSPRVRLTR